MSEIERVSELMLLAIANENYTKADYYRSILNEQQQILQQREDRVLLTVLIAKAAPTHEECQTINGLRAKFGLSTGCNF